MPKDVDWRWRDRVLALRITNSPAHSQRAMVRDRAKDPVEQRLNTFLARLAETAKLLKVRREEAELQRQKWAAEEKAREEARQKAEVENARFRRIEHLARLWQRREGLLAFVAAVKERMKVGRD